MAISFNFTPSDIRIPGAYAEFDSSKALSGLPAVNQKILLIGQRNGATATVGPLVPTRITSTAEALAAFGRGSMLALMFAALKTANDRTETWGIGVNDIAGGTFAAAPIVVSGPANGSGTIALYIAGMRVGIGVTIGDSIAVIAANIAAAINANLDLPVTAAASPTTVTVTARNKGTAGNDIDIRHSYYDGEKLPLTVGLAITPMAGGATNPAISDVWPVLGDAQFDHIVLPYADATTLASVEAELARRAGPLVLREGIAYGGLRGTQGALAAIGAARNSEFVSIIGAKNSPSHPAAWAAAYAGTVAYHASIDPARPFQTLAMNGLLAPVLTDRFTAQERELLLRDGISTFTVDPGGAVRIERAITTYQTNAQALDDVSYLDLNTPLTLFYCRLVYRTRILTKFSRCKLADDNARFGAGQAIVTPSIIKAEFIATYRDLETAGLVEDAAGFKQDLIVERDATDRNRINALLPINIVNQLRVTAAKIEFRL